MCKTSNSKWNTCTLDGHFCLKRAVLICCTHFKLDPLMKFCLHPPQFGKKLSEKLKSHQWRMRQKERKKDIFWIPCAVLKPKLKNHEISSAVAQAMDSTDLCVVQEVLYRSTTRVVANIHWNTALQQRNNSTSDSQQHQLVTEHHF